MRAKKWNDVCSCQRLSDRDRSVWNPKGGQFVNDSLFEAQLCHWLTFRGSTLSLTHFSGCKCGHEVGYNGYNFARQMKNLWNDWKCCRCKAFRRGVCVWPCSYYLLSTSNHHPSLGKNSHFTNRFRDLDRENSSRRFSEWTTDKRGILQYQLALINMSVPFRILCMQKILKSKYLRALIKGVCFWSIVLIEIARHVLQSSPSTSPALHKRAKSENKTYK